MFQKLTFAFCTVLFAGTLGCGSDTAAPMTDADEITRYMDENPEAAIVPDIDNVNIEVDNDF